MLLGPRGPTGPLDSLAVCKLYSLCSLDNPQHTPTCPSYRINSRSALLKSRASDTSSMANANGSPPDGAGGGGVVLAGLALVWLPTVIIMISFAGLMQFKLMYGALSSLFQVRRGGMVWRKIQPTMGDIVASLEASIGPASKFTPSLTHILLVGVILAVLVAGERITRR